MLPLTSSAVIGQKLIKITFVIGQPLKENLTNHSASHEYLLNYLLLKHVAKKRYFTRMSCNTLTNMKSRIPSST